MSPVNKLKVKLISIWHDPLKSYINGVYQPNWNRRRVTRGQPTPKTGPALVSASAGATGESDRKWRKRTRALFFRATCESPRRTDPASISAICSDRSFFRHRFLLVHGGWPTVDRHHSGKRHALVLPKTPSRKLITVRFARDFNRCGFSITAGKLSLIPPLPFAFKFSFILM